MAPTIVLMEGLLHLTGRFSMEIGVSVPIVEIGDDFGALRDYIQAAEDLGYAHVRILDHVLGAVPERSIRRYRSFRIHMNPTSMNPSL